MFRLSARRRVPSDSASSQDTGDGRPECATHLSACCLARAAAALQMSGRLLMEPHKTLTPIRLYHSSWIYHMGRAQAPVAYALLCYECILPS